MKSKVLVFGGGGLVGSRFIEVYSDKLDIKFPNSNEINILNKNQIEDIVKSFKPDNIINFAAYTDTQGAEEQNDNKNGSCYQINVVGAKNVASVCQETGTKLIHISTDYVFDGQKQVAPFTEEDQPNPKNWYGQTKYLGEQAVLESECHLSLVRISMPFSARYDLKKDIARFFLNQLKNNQEIKAITDQKVTPVLVDDVANALFKLIQIEALGIYHIVVTDWTTPFDFATLIAKAFNLDKSLIKPISLDEYNKNKKAKLLKYAWLDSSKFINEFGENILHTIEESLKLFKEQVDRFS